MTQLLIRRFVADYDNVNKPAVRKAYGLLSGGVGICVNLLLCTMKSDRVTAGGTMDEVIQTAKGLGVTVTVNGYLPADSLAEELTVAAAKECVTNCIRHAGGNEVYICIFEQNDLFDITITKYHAVAA